MKTTNTIAEGIGANSHSLLWALDSGDTKEALDLIKIMKRDLLDLGKMLKAKGQVI